MEKRPRSKSQDKAPSLAKESRRARNPSAFRSKARSLGLKADGCCDSDVRGGQQVKRGAGDKRTPHKTGESAKPRKTPTVTFSQTVSCTRDPTIHNARKTNKRSTGKTVYTRHANSVSTTETSDTDSTVQKPLLV